MSLKQYAESAVSRAATIGTIADFAGVSKSTVSLALRNSSKIQKATCHKIQAIAQEMNYRPNPLVAAQMIHIRQHTYRKSAPTIGFLHIWNSNTDNKEISWKKVSNYYKGVKNRGESHGFAVDLFDFDRAKYSDARIRDILYSRNVEGLILAPSPLTFNDLKLQWENFTLSAIGCFEVIKNIHGFFFDGFACIQQVMDTLKARGYTRVGFVTNEAAEAQTGHLLSGGFLEYQSRLIPRESEVPLLRLPRQEECYTAEDFQTTHQWVISHRPDAVIGIGCAVSKYLQSAGYKLPDDIGYVAIGWSNSIIEGCAGYSLNEQKVSEAAVDSLATRLYHNERGLSACPITALLYGEFIDGGTLRSPTS